MMEIDDDHPPENDERVDVSNANFISSLSNPLRGYAQTCVLSSPITSDETNDTPTQPQQQQHKLDEFEISVRSHLLELIEQLLSFQSNDIKTNHQNNNDDDDGALQTLLQYLKDVSLLCLHISTVQPATITNITAIKKLPFLLVEDAIDSLPLTLIQRVWSSTSHPTLCISSYILSNNHNTNILTTPQLFIPTSKFVLLRICNKLLKLLSNRDAHANFAGEIMMLLARVFPLSERSAMNVLGGFNVGNGCGMESLEEFRERKKKGGDGDEKNNNGGGDNAVGYEFYAKFWGLQKVFTDPSGTILTSSSARGAGGKSDRAQAYEIFVKDVTDVLEALESTPLVHDVDAATSSSYKKNEDNDKKQQEEAQEHVRHHKYLTSSQLLHLQLKDPTLRIHFLTQLLIILSYLASLPSTLLPTGVQATAGADTSKLTAQIRQTQMKQLGLIEKRVQKLLSRATTSTASSSSSTGKGGGSDANNTTTTNNNGIMWKSLQWILRDRESMWKNWKKAKCLPAMDRVATTTYTASGSDVQKLLVAGKKRKLEHSTNATSTTTASDELNIETLAKVTTEIKTSSQPTLTTFFDPYVEALDPENGIEGEYHPRNDKVYTWRGLRLMARDQEEGQLKRFGKLRRKDGDFEGIVRDIWKERGEEIPGGLGEDYYQEEIEEEEEVATTAAGGKNDAEMDDVSVGSTQEEAIAKKEEEEAKKKRMAEFEKAAMEVEEDILDETTATTIPSGDTEKTAVDEGQKSNRSSYASLADAVAPITTAKEPAKEDKKKDEKPSEAKEDKNVEAKKEEKKVETKNENGKDVKREDNGSKKDKTDSKSPEKGKNGSGKGKKEGGNGKKDGNKGSTTNTGRNSNNSNNNQNNKGSDNKKNDSKQQSRSRAKFTPPQKVQQHQKKSEPQRDNSNSRGGGGGGGGGGNRRGGNDRRGGNNMPPPPQSRGGGNRDGRAHTPPNQGGPGPRGGDQRGGNNGPPRGGGGGPGRGWEPPAGKGNFHPGQGGGGGRGGGGGGGRGGSDRRRHGRR